MKAKIKKDNSKYVLATLVIILMIVLLVGTWFTLTATNWLMIKPKPQAKNIAYGKITVTVEEQKNFGQGEVSLTVLPRP